MPQSASTTTETAAPQRTAAASVTPASDSSATPDGARPATPDADAAASSVPPRDSSPPAPESSERAGAGQDGAEQDIAALGRGAVDTSGGDGRNPPPLNEPVPHTQAVRSGGLQVGLEAPVPVALDDSVPGEVAGEATSVGVKVRNESQQPISLTEAFAQATKNGGEPAVEHDGRRGGDFTSALAPGQDRVLTFVFATTPDQLTRVAFGYAPDQALTQFEVK